MFRSRQSRIGSAPAVTLSLTLLAGCASSPGRTLDDVPVSERIQIPGLSGEVSVARDEWGRPHIYATSDADLYRAMGFVHAYDRFLQMDIMRRFASGSMAELAGVASPDLVDSDHEMRVVGLRRTSEMVFKNLAVDDPIRTQLTDYAAGVNSYIELIKSRTIEASLVYSLLEYPLSDIPAWSEIDSLSVGRLLAFDLTWDGDDKVKHLQEMSAIGVVFDDLREGLVCDLSAQWGQKAGGSTQDPSARPSREQRCPLIPPDTTAAPITAQQVDAMARFVNNTLLHPLNFLFDPARGSNNWVVSGSSSASGAALLANDPHLGLSIPSIWHDIHLNTARSGGNLDVVGMSLPGVPSIIIGHNGRVAWGVTNVGPDVTDNYIEKLSQGTGANGVDQAWFNGEWVDLVKIDEVIKLRTRTGVKEEIRAVWLIPHRNGSIITGTQVETEDGTWRAISWRWTGMEPTNELTAFRGLALAQSAEDVRAALGFMGVPPQNFVYATASGEIGWAMNGLYPVRDDHDNNPYTYPAFFPMPGDGSHEWKGFVSAQDLPTVSNPDIGFFQSANQDPTGRTLDGDPLNDEGPYFGYRFDIGLRGEQIQSRLAAAANENNLTIEEMKSIQADHRSLLAARMVPFLLQAMDAKGLHPDIRDLLLGWRDRGYLAASGVGDNVSAEDVSDAAATSFFNAWLVSVNARTFNDELAVADVGGGSMNRARALLEMLENPKQLLTYSNETGDSILWDNLKTTEIESRSDTMLFAVDKALSWLESDEGFGSSDPTTWLWGDKHRLTLEHIAGVESFNVPTAADARYPGGFPRAGDNYGVDAANPGFSSYDFTYGGGASMRMIVEAEPDNFKMLLSFPGGASDSPASPHYADRVEPYARNEYQHVWFYEREVAKAAKGRMILQP